MPFILKNLISGKERLKKMTNHDKPSKKSRFFLHITGITQFKGTYAKASKNIEVNRLRRAEMKEPVHLLISSRKNPLRRARAYFLC